MVKYKNTSMYKNTPITDNYLGLYEPVFEPNLEIYNTITLSSKYDKRPDLLAYELYGQSELWWIFVLYNRDIITDPIFDFVSGLEIKIPKNIADIGF